MPSRHTSGEGLRLRDNVEHPINMNNTQIFEATNLMPNNLY